MDQKAAELVSLGLTVPTIVLAGFVVILWGTSAAKAAVKEHRSATEWFILGVASGFAGSLCDNLYWAIPWSADFLGHESSDDLMMNGVYFNIFSRQMAGIFSAYCHVRAYFEYTGRKNGHRTLHLVTTGAFVLGTLAAAALIYLDTI